MPDNEDTINIPPVGLQRRRPTQDILNAFTNFAQTGTLSGGQPITQEQMNEAHRRQLQAQSEQMMAARHEKYPLLEDITPVRAKRRVNMPAFRLHFDNLQDIQRRLNGVLIYIGGDLYLVREIHEEDRGLFMLYISDKHGDKYRCPFSHPEVNLRTPEPRYVQYNQQPHYFYRPPFRVQQQGVGNETAYVKPVFGAPSRASNAILIKALNKHETLPWSSMYSKLMLEDELFESLRLSNTIAFGLRHERKKPVLKAEYKGRHLGVVRDDTIFVDTTDHEKSWIRRDVELIGCKTRTGEKNAA